MPVRKPGEEAQLEREKKPQYWDRLAAKLAKFMESYSGRRKPSKRSEDRRHMGRHHRRADRDRNSERNL